MPNRSADSVTTAYRLQLKVTGAVQGVGFRPFVYRLARELELTGFVLNNSQGVTIEVEGDQRALELFNQRFRCEIPPLAMINGMDEQYVQPMGSGQFVIATSDDVGSKTALVLPDIATCGDCLREIFDPQDRRYHYPFTNCTNCGPRYSIIDSLPYDRTNTTLNLFTMCEQCAAEYADPANRRFHAQPNACPNCGPRIELWDTNGNPIADSINAIERAFALISDGKILALKGLGGFQLLVDAANAEAVGELRFRKRRSNKPFALMYPSVDAIQRDCALNQMEIDLLNSPESPIVICARRDSVSGLAAEVAPSNPYLGVMLPYTPLHHILMRRLNRPVVATSGNLSDEPLCIDEREALLRLADIADHFLVHDRPIRRHVDDSVVRVLAGRAQVIRRARGYAPLPILLQQELPETMAVGGHLKNAVAIAKGRHIFVSQHIGDLESLESNRAFKESLRDLADLYALKPTHIAHDLHPDYSSTLHAASLAGQEVSVQHHYAHVLSCMADNNVDDPVLGVSWDGTGFGLDRTIWGGEFLAVDETSFERVAYFKPFRLPGGDTAAKEPRRSAAGILYEICCSSIADWRELLPENAFSDNESEIIWRMLSQDLNAPQTSSVGRLFDAISAITGLSHKCTFEGEGAMLLEFAIGKENTTAFYEFELKELLSRYEIDWRPMINAILEDHRARVNGSLISAKFHNTLTEIIVAVAYRNRLKRVMLTGGCFQNKYLLEYAISRLRQSGFTPNWHRQIPTNDGGIAVGQIIAVARAMER